MFIVLCRFCVYAGYSSCFNFIGASAQLTSCDFRGNVASAGGAVSLYGYVGGTTSAAHRNKIRSKLIIHHGSSPTLFTSNLAKPNGRSAFAKGGALYIGGTSLYDSSSATNQQPGHSKAVVFQQNKAQSGGAVFITASGEGFFGNTMFENNTADRHQQGGTNDGGNGGT